MLSSRAVIAALLSGLLGGALTWTLGRFALARLRTVGRTGADASLGAALLSAGGVLTVGIVAALVVGALLTLTLLARDPARRTYYLTWLLTAVGWLAGMLAAVYVGLAVLTE